MVIVVFKVIFWFPEIFKYVEIAGCLTLQHGYESRGGKL